MFVMLFASSEVMGVMRVMRSWSSQASDMNYCHSDKGGISTPKQEMRNRRSA